MPTGDGVRPLPSGTLTFLFTDIEGSTQLLHALGASYADVITQHHAILRDAITHNEGREVGTEGDSFFVVFERPSHALGAALDAQIALANHEWPGGRPVRVRMGIHTGEASVTNGDYVGIAIHEAARISSAAHGGQVLLSQVTRDVTGSSLPASATTVDIGEHRLKDIPRPIRLYELAHDGLGRFGYARVLAVKPNNLPSNLSTFVGRVAELADVRKALEGTRLLTLVGPGGSGKTRLAVELGHALLDEAPDGVWFVDLSTISDGSLIWSAIAQALDLRDQFGEPTREAALYWVNQRAPVLILDNCEHLTAPVAAVVREVLTSSSARVVATSRESLNLEGELIWHVPPLTMPSGGDVQTGESSDAVRLFLERAARVRSIDASSAEDISLIERICRRLDGMPLAIELAAARTRSLSTVEIAERLSDRFKLLTVGQRTGVERHRTLRTTIDWSYELLDEVEQTLFRRLGVFARSFTIDAVESVCTGGPVDASDVVDLLAGLVDRSLVVADVSRGRTRYRLLETMRDYASQALAATDEQPAVELRHLQWVASFIDSAVPLLHGVHEAAWYARLMDSIDDVRQAIAWSEANGHPRIGLRIASLLYRFWWDNGLAREGADWIERLLPSEPAPTADRARALAGLCYQLVEVAPADLGPLLEECSKIPVDEHSARWVGLALYKLANLSALRGAWDEAEPVARQARAIGTRWNEQYVVAQATLLLAIVRSRLGDRTESSALYDEAIAIADRIGDLQVLCHVLDSRASALRAEGRPEEARRLQRRHIETCELRGTPSARKDAAEARAALAEAEGDYPAYEAIAREAVELAHALGARGEASARDVLLDVLIDRAKYDEARSLSDSLLRSSEPFPGSEVGRLTTRIRLETRCLQIDVARQYLRRWSVVAPQFWGRLAPAVAALNEARLSLADGDPDRVERALEATEHHEDVQLTEIATGLRAGLHVMRLQAREAADLLAGQGPPRTFQSPLLLVTWIDEVARVAGAAQRPDVARALFARADALHDRLGAPRSPFNEHLNARWRGEIAHAEGPDPSDDRRPLLDLLRQTVDRAVACLEELRAPP